MSPPRPPGSVPPARAALVIGGSSMRLLIVEDERPLAPVLADPLALGQVVSNLLDNAQQHASSRVVLELHEHGSMAELVVSDDGPGIPLPDRERVFERFVRLDVHRSRNDGGTGLGLAICREIVGRHGGTITIDDSAVGTRVVVKWPIGPIAA